MDEDEAAEIQRWAGRLGVDRSELLRQALHRHLIRLRSEEDIDAWSANPLAAEEQALAEIAHWGPGEDWGDWDDAAR